MTKLDHIKYLYFIGIGGIGMSALARYFHAEGKTVAGYDKTPGAVTRALEDLGIEITYKDEVENLPEFIKNRAETLVIFTPAVPKSHAGYQFFLQNEFAVKKRAEVLGLISKQTFCLAVAGTHGKTTTSSILGHLLAETGAPVTAFLGGIAENYNSNLIQKGSEVIVAEADEFDRSFLHLHPNIACITSMDADHLDIYGDAEALTEGFKAFADQVVEGGTLFIQNGLPLEGVTVGVDDNAQYSAQNIRIQDGAYHFDLHYPDGILENLVFNLPGRHNLSNAVTALAMAILYGSPISSLAGALFNFKGVNRRFTYRIKTNDLILIDDYAHHPTEIEAVHQSVREMYPGEQVLAVFQPHLFSRTRDFMPQFADSLSMFDEVILLDIYPAREEPIAGVDSQHLLEQIKLSRKQIVSKEKLSQAMQNSGARIQVMMGAGDIGEEILKITNLLAV
ncbi:UDP-N-acetylmuramate--L-alanine ligase [Leeuwenhoekiella sp. A16]|uniref:UDP-N-acetylmuramate--L-alanine ligase n=1 Tax=unclassified Leeuwenhoekiella TaxID=2615029 RepID=UPI003A7F95E8